MRIQQTCPVCEGRGNVYGGFYLGAFHGSTISTSATEPCRNCKGKGVVIVYQECENITFPFDFIEEL